MTDQPFPITPSPELRRLWAQQAQRLAPHDPIAWLDCVATKAAQWGADQELKACAQWLDFYSSASDARDLRDARRPKPPSLKEQALAVLDDCANRLDGAHENTIRRALEAQ